MVLHGLDLDGADTGRIGKRGPRHAGKDHRTDDVDLGETTLHPADERDGEGIDTSRHAGRVHEITGKDEKWHGQQREAFHTRDQALRRYDIGRDIIKHDVEQRSRGHGNGDRQADQHQEKKGADEKQHVINPPRSGILRAAPERNNRAAYWR